MGRKQPNPLPPNIPNKPTPPPAPPPIRHIKEGTQPPKLTEGKMRGGIKQIGSIIISKLSKPESLRPKNNKGGKVMNNNTVMMYGVNEPEKEDSWIKRIGEDTKGERNNLWEYKKYVTGPFICPVCKGKGVVDKEFYPDPKSNALYIKCRTCKGKGIVWKR